VIVGAFVVAAVFTPPDVISQLMMAIPLCLLFELGLFLARFVGQRSARHCPDDQPLRKPRSTLTADWTPLSAQEMDAAIKDLGTQQNTDRKPDA
jgi:sec-independent protein translocase protein TatC